MLSLIETHRDALLALEDRFSTLEIFTPEPRPRSRLAPADAPDPEPDYQLVFRPATPGEWDNVRALVNKESQKHQAPLSLARATIIGVSFCGTVTLIEPNADAREGRKPLVAALDALIRTPGFAAVPEAVFPVLWEFNGGATNAPEKA